MNRTPRALNRVLLGILGAVLIAAGTAAAWAGTSRGFARQWAMAGTRTWDRVQANLAAGQIAGTGISWWTVAVLAVLLLAAVLLVTWIASQGTGRSNELARQEGSAGNTSVDTAVAAEAVKAALAGNTQVLSTSVQSWKTRGGAGGTGLKISVQARKGASPVEVGSAVDHLVNELDGLLGAQIPVLVRIKAGTRTRFARTERVA